MRPLRPPHVEDEEVDYEDRQAPVPAIPQTDSEIPPVPQLPCAPSPQTHVRRSAVDPAVNYRTPVCFPRLCCVAEEPSRFARFDGDRRFPAFRWPKGQLDVPTGGPTPHPSKRPRTGRASQPPEPPSLQLVLVAMHEHLYRIFCVSAVPDVSFTHSRCSSMCLISR